MYMMSILCRFDTINTAQEIGKMELLILYISKARKRDQNVKSAKMNTLVKTHPLFFYTLLVIIVIQ